MSGQKVGDRLGTALYGPFKFIFPRYRSLFNPYCNACCRYPKQLSPLLKSTIRTGKSMFPGLKSLSLPKSVWSFVHNLLMVGSPGARKTFLLARAMPSILPEMSIEASLDVTRIYSVADQLPAGTPLILKFPELTMIS